MLDLFDSTDTASSSYPFAAIKQVVVIMLVWILVCGEVLPKATQSSIIIRYFDILLFSKNNLNFQND